jgi:16S rRNA (uracil1498-N3)-methyltransferase
VSRRRFHVRPEAIQGARCTFDRDEARHIARVLRLRAGDVVAVVDGQGREYAVRLDRVSPGAAVGTVLGVEPRHAESPLAITLAQAVPKGDRMDAIVRAATELGVARVVPLVTARTIVRLDGARALDRVRRWQRVATEATKQCGRAVIPPVDPPRLLADFVGSDVAGGLRLCLWEGVAPRLGAVLDAGDSSPVLATVLIGPEGGFTEDEVGLARSHGFILASLGPRVLRTETAGLTVIAALQLRFGDLRG